MSDESQVKGDDIHAIQGLEGIRLRPAMYVGSIGEAGVARMLQEAMCLFLENAAGNCCSLIQVEINTDGSATIYDDGHGFDLSVVRSLGKTTIEVLLTELLACRDAKIDEHVREQLCRAGVVVTNSLSEWLVIETAQDGWLWRQRYERGEPVSAISKVEPATDSWQRMSFLPDASILESTDFRVDLVKEWFEELTIDFGDVAITLEDKRDGSSYRLHPRSS